MYKIILIHSFYCVIFLVNFIIFYNYMNSQQYLDMVNQLKEKYDKVEKFSETLKKKEIDLKKLLSIVYVFGKEINDNIGEDLPPCYRYMLERLVALTSRNLFYEKDDDLELEEVDFSLVI
jgi:hypothetical protein